MRVAIALLFAAIACCLADAAARACGTERWPPKVFQDADAPSINPVPQDTTISALLGLTAPSSLPYDRRIAPAEFTVYRLRNVTLWWMHTSSDGDDHIEVKDAAGHSMIAESPDTACLGSQWFSQTSAVRKIVAEHYTVTSNGPSPNVPVTLTGVGFFDYILSPSSNPGEAPNGIELHPLLSICFGLNCSPVTASPAFVTVVPNGGNAALQASEEFYSGAFTATSANTSIATVTGTGGNFTVTGHAEGTTSISIEDAQYNSITVPVNVSDAASFSYAASAIAAPLTPFYTYREGGAVSLEIDPAAQGSATNETLTEAGNETGANFGWVTPPGTPGLTAWPAQNFSVRLQIIVPNPNLQITEVKLLRVDSSAGPGSNGLAVAGDLPNLSQPLSTAGTLVFNIAAGAQAADATDRLAVKFYVRNASASSQSFSYRAGSGTLSAIAAGASPTPAPLPTPAPSPAPTPMPASTPTSTYTSTVLADGPAQYYELVESGGTLAADSSGNNTNGTYVGAVSYGAPGPLLDEQSAAIALAGGTASSGVSLPNPKAGSGTSYTIEAWVYPVRSGGYTTIWGYDSTHRMLLSASGLLLTQFGTNFFSKHALSANAWHDVAFVYDAGNSTASYYVDGQFDSSAKIANAAAAFTSGYYLGQYDASTNYKWNGRLAQAALYLKPLTQAQLAAHYSSAGYATPAPIK